MWHESLYTRDPSCPVRTEREDTSEDTKPAGPSSGTFSLRNYEKRLLPKLKVHIFSYLPERTP